MEVRTVATAEATRLDALLQLLSALSGHTPEALERCEITLEKEGAGSRQELHLQWASVPRTENHPSAQCWWACQYGRPPWGDLALAKLDATVRTVNKTECAGPNVPAFWHALGYATKYRKWKSGYVFDVHQGAWTVHVYVSRLFKVIDRQQHVSNDVNDVEAGLEACKATGTASDDLHFQRGAEVSPGYALVEAWVDVGSRGHTEAIEAVVQLGKLLAREGVKLQPLLEKPRAQPRRR